MKYVIEPADPAFQPVKITVWLQTKAELEAFDESVRNQGSNALWRLHEDIQHLLPRTTVIR